MSGDENVDPYLESYNLALSDTRSITGLLQKASMEAHLVSPATSCGQLAEGFALAFSTVLIDIERETYPSGPTDDEDEAIVRRPRRADGVLDYEEKRALGRTALDRIALAMGISWDAEKSRRTDDGRNPYYCSCVAVGSVEHFDGRIIQLPAEPKEVDLRDGSPYVEWLRQKKGKGNADRRIRNERIHILSLATTKARLRAVRDLGIRAHYTREELGRPFVVVRRMFTGTTADPDLRRTFAVMIAQQALEARAAAFGPARARAFGPVAPEPKATPATRSVRAPQAGAPGQDAGSAVPDAPDAGPRCDYCGDAGSVRTARTPQGPIQHCGKPQCLGLAQADHLRAQAAPPPDRRQGATPAPYPPATGPDSPPRDAGSRTGRPTPAADASSPPGRAAAGAPRRSGHLMPGGDRKGEPIEDVDDEDLTYWIDRIEKNLRSRETPAHFVDKNRKLLAAMRAELDLRTADGCGEGADTYPH